MTECRLSRDALFVFAKDVIYTNVADVLVSVNPYKNIPLLYEIPLEQMQDELEDEFEESDGENEVSRTFALGPLVPTKGHQKHISKVNFGGPAGPLCLPSVG